MKTFRLIHCLWITHMLLITGCHLTITVGDGPIGDDNTSMLPDPSGGDPPPPLDEAQQARADEAAFYTANVIYQGATITQAIQLPSGDIIDGLDRNTLPAVPYALPALPVPPDALQLPAGVEFGVPDFEKYAELAELVNTATPVQRPDFSAYIMGETDATSIEDYLDRYQVGGQPWGSEHLYAGLISREPNRGAWGYMNQFHPEVEPGTFSLMEFAVACPTPAPGVTPQEVIGIVISVDKLNRTGRGGGARLHIEYAVLDVNGKVTYHWDGWNGKFKWNPFSRYRPGQLVDVSVLAGTQVEHLVGIFQEPIGGDWWIFYKDNLLGYFPVGLFKQLNTGACASAFYIEGARQIPLSPKNWLKTEGGSGQHAIAGPLLAAYVRNPTYVGMDYWFRYTPSDVYPTNWMFPYKPECYSRTYLKDGYVFFGGPGGKDPACIWPPPPSP